MTHYILAMTMTAEQQEYFVYQMKHMKFQTETMNPFCDCDKEVGVNIRELRIYEVTVRESAQKDFERYIADWLRPMPFRKFIRWFVQRFTKRGIVSAEISNMRLGGDFNSRNYLMFKYRNNIEKDDNNMRCHFCKKILPNEWT